MEIKTAITSIQKYFTSYSVDSLWGYKKVSLVRADDSKIPTGYELVIDATESVNVSITKSVQSHSSESKKVYMDGTKINPVKMTITGHIDTGKLQELQKLAKDEVWMYVSMTKDMGGSILSMSKNRQGQIGRIIGTAESLTQCDIDGDSGIQMYADSKLYFINELSIDEQGFVNTVLVTINLTEVVLFEYDVDYKYGVRQATDSGKAQQGVVEQVKSEKPVEPLKTRIKAPTSRGDL